MFKGEYEIATYKGDNLLNKRTEILKLSDTEVSANLPTVIL